MRPEPAHELPPHLINLVPDEWAAWRWFVLRGSGFPIQMLSGLSEPEVAVAADRLVTCEASFKTLLHSAANALEKTLDELHQNGEGPGHGRFNAVLNARRKLRAGKIPSQDLAEFKLGPLLGSITNAITEQKYLQAEFETAFARAIEHQTEELQKIARHPRFQEAVIWQNRSAFETGLRYMAERDRYASGAERNQRQRIHEQMTASYAQRYAAKNDTIGFFGPVGWARLEDRKNVAGNSLIEMVPGPSLLKLRNTYFEDWAIDSVAKSLSLLPGIEWWIAPRLSPHFYLENGVLCAAGSQPIALSNLEDVVLGWCNGENLPMDMLSQIQGNPSFQNVEKDQFHELLKSMDSRGIILWRFLVPIEANSEINLGQQLQKIGDVSLRKAAMDTLEKLEAARQEVSCAAGNPAQLNSSLGKLENIFETAAQTPAQRHAGVTYGGRTIVYEDCQRNLNLTITSDLLAPILPALALLLKGARWLMQSTALGFQEPFHQAYSEVAACEGKPEIAAELWWSAALPRLMNVPAVVKAEQNHRQKWSEILTIPEGESFVRFDSDLIQARVEQEFPDFAGGFHPVRYYCPDLLLAASDVNAMQRGELLYVLGELHCAKNSLIHTALTQQHPHPQELADATGWDLSECCFKILTSRELERTMTRVAEGVARREDFFLSTHRDAIAPTGFTAHPISDLLIREQDGELMAVTRNGSHSFHILEAFADLLFAYVLNRASWIAPSSYTPRVAIDRLIIQRETWRATASEMAFALDKNESQRYFGMRRWMKNRGTPNVLFVKTPNEMKPFYVNLDSPVSVEILCKAIRRLHESSASDQQVAFSEMLPSLNDTWLEDAEGNHYTSELRLAIVDLKARKYSKPFELVSLS